MELVRMRKSQQSLNCWASPIANAEQLPEIGELLQAGNALPALPSHQLRNWNVERSSQFPGRNAHLQSFYLNLVAEGVNECGK
jgi:hypothetical protein